MAQTYGSIDAEKRALLVPDVANNDEVSPSLEPVQSKPARRYSKIAIAAAFLLALKATMLFTIHCWSHKHHHGFMPGSSAQRDLCPQPGPAAQPSNWSSLYDYADFSIESAKRLSGAVQIPTQSFDDMGEPGKDARWAPFNDLRAYLKETFPTLHAIADLEIVNSHSMIFTLKGSKEELKPFMLMAHLDVVPATTSLERWTYPPFEGKIEGDWIYGRGTSDCKNNVIGIMTSFEYLLKNGFSPTRTFVLAFGQDEEIHGGFGAGTMAGIFEKRYGKNGIAAIVDEGGSGITEVYGRQFALPGMAEKGHGNFIIEVDTLGGHSSVPLSKHTSIGILSKIISAIEDDDTFQTDLRTSSPIWGYLQCVGTHGDQKQVPKFLKKALSTNKPDLIKVGEDFASQSLANRYLLETSKAVTTIVGGSKVNALPESAIVNINSRIDIYSDADEVAAAYSAIIDKVAQKYAFSFGGKSYGSAGNITLTVGEPSPPSPISPPDSAAFEVFTKAVQASFGPDVITAPSSMTGNTDTRHYTALSKNIYRWSPARTGSRLNAHTVDEKIQIRTHVEGIKFYTELVVQANNAGSEL